MKSLLILVSLLSVSPAFAGQSCLAPDEAGRISTLRITIQQAELNKPECVRIKGALACSDMAEKIELQYLQRKENGDADSCDQEVYASSNEELQ
ncbi:MAG: hypothetical protein ACXWQO_06655 [Bdellovibrionota bacterium]